MENSDTVTEEAERAFGIGIGHIQNKFWKVALAPFCVTFKFKWIASVVTMATKEPAGPEEASQLCAETVSLSSRKPDSSF